MKDPKSKTILEPLPPLPEMSPEEMQRQIALHLKAQAGLIRLKELFRKAEKVVDSPEIVDYNVTTQSNSPHQ